LLRKQTIETQPGLLEAALKNQVFISSLPWFVGYFTLLLLVLLLVMRMTLRQSGTGKS